MTCFGNFCADKSSRTAKRYATPAADRGIINAGSPMRLKLREAIVIATSRMAPNPYSLYKGVSFIAFSNTNAAAQLLAAIRLTMPRFEAPWSERAAVPEPAESDRLRRRCRKGFRRAG